MTTNSAPVWFITGCSSGIGKELAKEVLARGWRAIVTARDPIAVADIVRAYPDNAISASLDVTNRDACTAAIDLAMRQFGQIDALVNNAGGGYQASIEEGDEAEIEALFATNVFGLARLTRLVLPEMRRRRSGAIVNISSLAGLVGTAGGGYYCASKFAVEGLTGALAQEVAPLGIKVLCVEPGPFRTEFVNRSRRAPTGFDDYEETVGKRHRFLASQSGAQRGDPARAAKAIIAAVEGPVMPKRLVLGAAAYNIATASIRHTLEEIESMRETSLAADFPE